MRAKHYVYVSLLAIITLVSSRQSVLAQCASLPPVVSIGSTKLPNRLCTPVTADLTYTITFAAPLPAVIAPQLLFQWGDGTPDAIVNLTPGATTYTFTRTHAYPANSDCEYQVRMLIRTNNVPCASTIQFQRIPTWRTDAFNGGNVQLVSSTQGTNVHQVCEGVDINAVFNDVTTYNCNANYPVNYTPGGPFIETPNEQQRWQQLVYNTALATPRIPNVSVNAVPMPAAAGSNYQDPRGVFVMTTPVVVNDGRRRPTLAITAPGGFTPGFPTVGQEFEVTIRYWNFCNPYDNPAVAGPPADLINGDNAPVEATALIRIIDSPDPPNVANRDICSGDATTLTVTGALGAGFTYRWWNHATNRLAANQLGTGTTFAPNNAQAPVGQRTHFWVTVEGTTAGNCRSDATEVRLIRRTALSSPTPISGPVNLCPSSTYVYSVGTTPDNITITDATPDPDVTLATEYIWTVPAGWTINSGNGTNSINVTTPAAAAGGNVTVVRRYVTTPNCTPAATSLAVNVRARPTANITPNPADLCAGGSIQLNGNPSLPANAAGFTPSVSAHTWSGSTGILDADNVQQPNTLAAATAGAYPLTYVVTADFGGGVFCSSTAVNRTVNISANPGAATVGANQNICFATPPLISAGLGGNTPMAGTGTWSKVSGPGTVTFNPTANTPNATATVSLNGIYVLRWSIVNGTCSSQADVTVDYGTTPPVSNAGTNQDVCSAGRTTALNGSDPTFATGTWTQIGQPAGGTTTFAPNANARNATITTTVFGTYRYQWTITSGSCPASSSTVDVTFRVPPTATAPADFSRCVDNPPTAAFNIPVSGTFGGGAGGAHWEVSPGFGGGTFISGSANDTSNPVDGIYQPVAADYTAGVVRFRLVTDDPPGQCTPVNDEVIVTIDRLPTAADAGLAAMSVCGTTATLAGNTPSVAGAVGTWSTPTAGVTFTPNANAPNATANGLPVGTTRLTWTITTATGVCSPSSDFIDVTRNATPAFNAPTLAKCVDVPGGSNAVVTLLELQALNDVITGIAGSTFRTVQFFTDAARTTAYPASSALTNGTTIYITVTRTDVTPQCQTNGQFNVTINPRPGVTFQNPEFCESTVGSNTRTGINLTTFDNAIKNGVATNTVAWFTNAARTAPVATPTSVTANNGTRFYARVTNPTTTCTDTTSLVVRLNPIPSPNPLLGPTNVCADPTAAILYQLTVNNPGFTYTWSVPEPPFDIRLGGGSTDDLILLSFPVVVNPGQNISVIETSNKGCVGAPNIKTITVDTSPPPIVITGPGGVVSSAVCENQAGVQFSVDFLANTTYAWSVPLGSSIISGQGTNVILVNFGTAGGLVTVTPTTTSGCAGNPDDHAVAINKRPTLASISATVCSDVPSGITLSATSNPGDEPAATYNVVNVSVPFGLSPSSRANANGLPANGIAADVFTNNTGGPLTVQYTIVPVSALGCEGASRVVNLVINPEPVLDPTLSDVICSSVEDVNIVLKVATGSFSATDYEIVSVNANGLTPVAGTPLATGIFSSTVLTDDRWQNLTNAPVTVQYFVRPRNSVTGCVGDPAIPVTVTVNPEPQVTATSDVICSGESPRANLLSTTPPIAVTSYSWVVVANTGVSGAQSGTDPTRITDILVNNTSAQQTVTYEVRATASGAVGGCQGAPTTITVAVNPAPSTNNVDQIVCSTNSGGTTYIENLIALQPSINSDGSLTFTWHTSQADADGGINAMSNATASAYPLDGNPVFVRVSNGICFKVQRVQYTINQRPTLTASITSNYNGAQLSCATSSNGIITAVQPTDGTGPYQYSIDGGTSFFTSPIFNGLSASGNPYTVRVRDARGCTADFGPINFVAPAALTATVAITSNFNGRHIRCQGDNNGQITATPAGGTGAKTYSILELPSNTTGATTGVFTGLTAGTYTVVVRDINNCQFTAASVTLLDPPVIVANAVLTTPVSCNGASDGVITVTATGGTLIGPNYTFTISPGGTSNTTGVFTGLAANTYTVNVQDANGCIKTSNSVSVTQPSSLTAFASVTSNYNGAKISCPGANNAVITVTANGGNPGFTYVLVEAPGNTSGNATGVYTGVGPGTYTVSVTDSKLCNVVTVPVVITDPTPIDATGQVSSVISCNGGNNGEIRISATGGTGAYTFIMISPAGPTNSTGIFPGLAQGTYDFEVRDLNNCTDVVQVILAQPTAVTASALVQAPYNGAQISCNGASDGVITVTASGGTGALTYVFNQFPSNLTGMTTGVFTGVPPGTGYTFTVTDSKGCPAPVTAAVNVVEPTAIAASAAVTSNHNGQHISCPTSTDGQITVTASGGTGALTYRLDQAPLNTTGATTGIFTGVGAGSYTVTVRDANSCFRITTPVTVVPPPAVTASAAVTSNYNGRQITCNGASDGRITVTASGGVTPYSYILNEIPGNVSGATTGVFTLLPAGTYTVNVRDANNCPVVTLPVTISEPVALTGTSNVTSNYNGQQIRCVGSTDGTIRVTGSGGTGPYTFISIEVPGNVTGASTGIFTGLGAGSYTFTVRDANNCTFITPAVVISPPTPLNASALVTSNYHGSQISCDGANDGTITVTATGGTGALHYEFLEDLSNTSGATSGVFIGIGAGGPYTFRVTDANTCNVTTIGISITEPDPIVASAAITSNHNGQHISCPTSTDGQITVTAAGGTGVYSYRLDQAPLNTTGNTTGVYSNVGAGTYTVTVRDENGCFVITVPVIVVPPPPVTASAAVTSDHNGQQISCNGASDGELTVTAGGGVGSYTYLLNQIPANVTGATTGVFTGLPAGTYTVTVRDGNNCPVTTVPVTITQPAVLGATAAVTSNYNGQQISCNGASDGRIAITVSGGTGPFAYTSVQVPGNVTGATTGIFTGLPAGNYTFNVTDVNTCGTTTAQVTISEPAQLAATLAVTSNYNGRHVSCNGASDGELTVTVTTPGTGAATYTIDQIPTNASGRFSGLFTGVPPGSYTVTVRDANNCSIVTNSVTVDPTPAIVANAVVTKHVSCFAEANGIVTVTASGGTGSLDYLLIQDASNLTGAISGVFTGLRAGNYTVRVTDDNTCFVTTVQVTVTQPANLTITIAKQSPYNGFDLSCAGASDGEIRVTSTAGGTGPYTYALDGFPGNTTGQTSGIFTGLSAGLYTITVTDNNSGDPFGPCTRQSLPVFINDPIPLAVNLIGFSKQICTGDDPTPITQIANPIGGIGIYTYQWQDSIVGGTYTNIGGATSATFDPPPITVTTYYRRLLSSGSCATIASEPIEIKVNPLPLISNVTAPAFLCENNAMIVFYDFAPGQAPFFFSYTQETIDQSGTVIATKVVTNEISGDSKPVIQSPFVDDIRITVTGLRDFNGCVADPSTFPPHQRYIEVLKTSALFTATTATLCDGSPFSVFWNANPEVEYTFKWPEGPDAVFGPGVSGAQTDSRVLHSQNPTATQTLPIILTATNTLHLSNPLAPDCGIATHLENIKIFPTILPNIVVPIDSVCSGTPLSITNSTQGGTTHNWTVTRVSNGVVEPPPLTRSPGLRSTETFTINNNYANAQNPENYEIHYEILNSAANGSCMRDTTVTVTVFQENKAKIGAPKDPATAIPLWTAPSDDITFNNATAPFDPSKFTYTWVFSNNNPSTPADTVPGNVIQNPTYTFLNPGVGKRAILTVVNDLALQRGLPNGCATRDEFIFTINVPPLTALFSATPPAACLPTTIDVTNLSTGDFVSEWRVVNQTNNEIYFSQEFEPDFPITAPGRYTITLKVKNPFNATDEKDAPPVVVNVYSNPVAAFITSPLEKVFVPDQELRTDNGSASPFDPLTSTRFPIQYSWYFGDGSDSVKTDLVLNPNPKYGDEGHSPTHKYDTEGSYQIALVAINRHDDGFGTGGFFYCKDTAYQMIQARASGTSKIPNAFTPNPGGPNGGIVNEDGTTINDVFLPITKGVKEFQMQIFDRWGNLVFESRQQNRGWDGYDRNGNLVPAGVYVYKLILRMANDQRTTQVGDVTLIR